MTDQPLLSVDGLKTQFYAEDAVVRAVDGISFDVEPGEIVGLVGESGAGKSVAVRSIVRMIASPGEIVAGEVTYDGLTLVGFETDGDELVPRSDTLSESAIREEVRGNEIAVVFQDPMESLNPVYTVGHQVREFIQLNRDLSTADATSEAIDMLRKVGIPRPESRYDDYPHEFSGGMRQRVLIAMALGCEPRLIIADEPTTALDVTVEGQILDLVADVQAEFGTSFIWVTHDMGVVAEICDRVNVMYLGAIVERGTVDEIFHDTKHPYTEALLGSIPRTDREIETLEPIAGTMPAATDPPVGCRFHTRCPAAREACRTVDPPAIDVGEGSGHTAACIKHGDDAYEESSPIETAATVVSQDE
ncbi:ABC transporter ATP-binding protein [Halovivax cerinus]|uniref:Nickel import system ATP-binding protein NikD n=1 Tax=Halovivax cerinus TaxID=1487865 RepID=A0ABD5NLV2_9EURY|nr:ABC transporter ATP-binding protein [Halovivax cerinus]